MLVSIIVPVLNEEKHLFNQLRHLQKFRKQGHELIIVDGGSVDNTMAIAQQTADIVLQVTPCRAIQMNAGAQQAQHSILLFLHADTILPTNGISQLMSHSHIKNYWGRFNVRLSSDKLIFRVIEFFINTRSKLSKIATGDQAIFISANLFKKIGAYPEIALMEDVEICQQLKKISTPICLTEQVITSSRRWEQHGVFRTIFLMWQLRLYYFLGVSPSTLNKWYQ